MQYLNLTQYSGGGPLLGLGVVVLAILGVWSIVWKGLALWKAARRGENVWFIVLLIVNTVGILEILYVFVFSRKQKLPTTSPMP